MNNWIDKHSVNCYFCGALVDERDCLPADEYNDNDGGDICPKCQEEKMNDTKAKEIGNKIVEALNLKLKDGKIPTVQGQKTPTGLGHMIADLLKNES